MSKTNKQTKKPAFTTNFSNSILNDLQVAQVLDCTSKLYNALSKKKKTLVMVGITSLSFTIAVLCTYDLF
ncbi:hypothetical protein KFK09_002972 [Dendrobium nobile]|uniref:Uncharacterized protein n=1 Tax=Dendrobium nobile TaxID=94219 RepID=A0A8T3C8D8_DENNO|nr:hypothetical protein KFK09_002972 [Dendrobium nobile]